MALKRVPLEQKTMDEYLLLLAGFAAKRSLQLSTPEVDLTPCTGTFKPNPLERLSLGNVTSDLRTSPRIFREMQEAGALDSFDYSGGGSFSRKTYFGNVNEQWFKNFAPTVAKAPVFKIDGVKIKKESWSNEVQKILVEESTRYRALFTYNAFTPEEYVYIYLHQKDYDVINRAVPDNFRRNTHEKAIYPKALLKDLSKNVYHDHAIAYLEKHIEWAVKLVLGIDNDKVLGKINYKPMKTPDCKPEEYENWSEAFASKQLERISCFQTLLEITNKSYDRLLDAVNKHGGWDKFKTDSQAAFLKYLSECFPLHMDETEPDEELRKLCCWVAEGKDKGFSDRIQTLEKQGELNDNTAKVA